MNLINNLKDNENAIFALELFTVIPAAVILGGILGFNIIFPAVDLFIQNTMIVA